METGRGDDKRWWKKALEMAPSRDGVVERSYWADAKKSEGRLDFECQDRLGGADRCR
jgi:hypothetical protein